MWLATWKLRSGLNPLAISINSLHAFISCTHINQSIIQSLLVRIKQHDHR